MNSYPVVLVGEGGSELIVVIKRERHCMCNGAYRAFFIPFLKPDVLYELLCGCLLKEPAIIE